MVAKDMTQPFPCEEYSVEGIFTRKEFDFFDPTSELVYLRWVRIFERSGGSDLGRFSPLESQVGVGDGNQKQSLGALLPSS